MAVASAGPYTSLHLAPDRQPHQHPTTLFFTGRMPFLPPNQQRQSTEGMFVVNTKHYSLQVTKQLWCVVEVALQMCCNIHLLLLARDESSADFDSL